MTVENAKRFIRQAMQDKDLRDKLNSAAGPEEIAAILEEQNIPFTYPEFDEGFNNLLTGCQTAEDADRLREFRMWWEMISL